MEIHKLPKVLIVYLKRFSANRKIDDNMDIPLYFDDPDANTYELVGVVDHYGRMNGGHYVANVKINSRWFCMNDNFFTEISKSRVVSRQNAYMLFYERQ